MSGIASSLFLFGLLFSHSAKYLLTMFSGSSKYLAMDRKGPRRMSKARMDAYEAVFTALAHPVRRRILITLHFQGGSMTAGEIAGMFDHAWPTTTGHVHG